MILKLYLFVFIDCSQSSIFEGLPGVLGNKETLAKYRREQEHEPTFWEQGNKTVQIRRRKHFDIRNKECYIWGVIYGHLCTTVIGFVYFTQEIRRTETKLDCKTVGVFFSKSVNKTVKCGVRVLRARSKRASHVHRACEAREKKTSLPSLALSFQPLSRPFVWLLERTWIRRNTDCFAV